MTIKPVWLSILFSLISLTTVSAQRTTDELSTRWKFIRQDVSSDASTQDWQPVSVPHTWNDSDAQKGKFGNPGEKYGYYRGPGWYACPLDIPETDKGRRIFVRFEAASIVAQVYCNGSLVGEHRGAFTAFCFEITTNLHPGGSNELRVRVDNSFFPDVPPLTGDFNLDGGIYRPVHLIKTPPVCISPVDDASPGVYLTPRNIGDSTATLNVSTVVTSGQAAPDSPAISIKLLDAEHHLVASGSKVAQLFAHETRRIDVDLSIPQPRRWDGLKDPYLYTVEVSLWEDGSEIDSLTQPFGFRTVAITNEQGFLLNGQPYPIHGVNRHQDLRDKGWALSNADHDDDLKTILEMGATAVRLAHYPQSEYLHDACDRAGLLLWNELSLVNDVRDTPEFAANAAQQLRELILQRYNHPAAVFWSLFNELDDKEDSVAVPLLEHLKAEVQRLDATRLIVAASCHSNMRFNRVADWTAYNEYFGWYHDEMDGFTRYIADRYHENGDRRIAVSEYGAGGNPWQHQEGLLTKPLNTGPFHPEEWQAAVHERDWAQFKANPKLWGTFLWVMFDFPSAGRNEGSLPGINDKGLVTQDRKIRKDAYYFYQANWTRKPMVYITSRRMMTRKLALTEVKVYSNRPSVELKINGKSLGIGAPDDECVFRWKDVFLSPGPNHVEASIPGDTLQDACDWTLEAR